MFTTLRIGFFLCAMVVSSSAWSKFNYSVYHGAFYSLPDFSTLDPVLTGVSDTIDVSVRDRDYNVALVFTHQIIVSHAGTYEFQTLSDDGSKLYIDNRLVVDNDGVHPPISKMGEIFLNPGTYALRIEYFELGGGEVLNVRYRAANADFAPIPTSGRLAGSDQSQFSYSVYHGAFFSLPDFSTLDPVLTGFTDTIDVSVRDRDYNVALVFTHQITVTQAAVYEFQTLSDDGSKLYVDNTVVVDNDGVHPPISETGEIFLNPGTYALRVEYFELGGGEVLNVRYRVANGEFEPIPSSGQLTGSDQPQFDYSVYHGAFYSLPDFSTLDPVLTGVTETIDVSVRDRDHNVALVFTHQIIVSQAATYEFQTLSDDGSRLYIDNTVVVDNDGVHPPISKTGEIFLYPGTYALRVEYFELGGGQTLEVNYRVIDGIFAPIPTSGVLNWDVPRVHTNQITITQAATYEFQTLSDNGSQLSIENAIVVDSDGVQAPVSETGEIYLNPGTYTLNFQYVELAGSEVPTVLYRIENGDFTPIPSNGQLAGSDQSQFNYSVYHGAFNSLPDFSTLDPVLTGTTDTIDLSIRDRDFNFALVFTNQITVTQAATYEFRTHSDDGSKLYIDNVVVVDNDGTHGPVIKTGVMFLNPGTYSLRVEYFELGGGETLEVNYRVVDGSFATIPASGQLNGDVPSAANVGQWGPVIDWPHIAISAANLPDGRVLTWSSTETNGFRSDREYTHSAVFDPTTNTFLNSDSNFHDMFCAGISTLENGEIVSSGGNPFDNRTSMFDPDTLGWSPLTDMHDKRWYGTNLTLPNNQIFSTFAKQSGNRSEVFDLDSNSWTRTPNADMQTLVDEQNAINAAANPAGAMNMEWWAHMAVTPDGRVFQGGPTPTFHVFDPVSGTANEVLGEMAGERARMYGNTVTYDVGKVLLVGGADRRESQPTSTSNVYSVDLNGPTPIISQRAPMNYPRALSNSVTLPNGEILVVGGNTVARLFTDEGSILPAEIYNPTTNTWRVVDELDIPRNYHSTALLLKDGRVLSAGGGACGDCAANHLDGQIFSPPYLFDDNGNEAVRPTISQAPSQIFAGQQAVVMASLSTERFSMVRLSGTTHHMNTDQRFVPVASQNNGNGTYSLSFNANPNVLIPGYYWLYAVDSNGTPSIGYTIQVTRNDSQSVDSDGDGVPDSEDAFPNDPSRTEESDGDNNGNNADAGHDGESTEGYRYYRFTPTKLRSDTANSVHLSELSFFVSGSRLSSAVVTNPGGNNPDEKTPDLANDNNTMTEWLDFNKGSLIYDFSINQVIDTYNFTTANSASDRDPVRWLLEASADGLNWVAVHDQTGTDFTTPAARLTQTANFTISDPVDLVTPLPEYPRNSSTILIENSSGQERVWNVNPDNNSVSVSNSSGSLITEITVGESPFALAKAPNSNRVFVTNKRSNTITVIGTGSLQIEQTVELAFNSQPYGIVFNSTGSQYFVVLESAARVEKRDALTHAVLASTPVEGVPRHIAIKYDDSQILISNFITPSITGESTSSVNMQAAAAEVFVLNTENLAWVDTINLTHDNRTLSESAGPGIPNYLNAPVISFNDRFAYIPSKKDNISSGTARSTAGLTFESTVRAQGSRIALWDEAEDTSFRVDFDNASVATGAALTGDNRYLLTALETSRELSVYDTVNDFELMRLPTGRAPQGVALSGDGKIAYVHNFMDRSISRFDLTELLETHLPTANQLPNISVVSAEALDSDVFTGKRLFYDAADDRLARDNYMSCASCHNDGGEDGRVWDFSQFGEGLRNTISLRGRAGTGHGLLHWSGNFDEVQDFENQIRNFAGGTGLMSDTDFYSGTRSQPLGDPKAGFSAELDAIAAYLDSLRITDANSQLSASGPSDSALRGQAVFNGQNCARCHSEPLGTDSNNGQRHNIGTLTTDSGFRLGENLDGLDTPTLHGLGTSAPYFHNGSASTVQHAIQAHSGFNLSEPELSDLANYLLELPAVSTPTPN